jgi:antitoxin MazE
MPATTKKRSEKHNKKAARLIRNSTLSQWGNSLGMRIPQEAVDTFGLRAGAQVEIEVTDETITIRPTRTRKKWRIEDLVKGVTPDKVGGELKLGPPVGKELL